MGHNLGSTARAVGPADDLGDEGVDRELRQRGIQEGDVVRGGPRPGVAGPQKARERSPVASKNASKG
jgi:hypothetical protein